MEYYLRGGSNDGFCLLLGKLGGSVAAAELHGLQFRQQGKVGAYGIQVGLGHFGQIQLLGIAGHFLAQNIHGIGKFNNREGLLHGPEILQAQVHFPQVHGFYLVQEQQAFFQSIQVEGIGVKV